MTATTPLAPASLPATTWEQVCQTADLLPGLGVCALVQGQQIALFSVAGHLYAVSNTDPFTGANVMSRGLTGSYTRDGQTHYKVASPLLKHAFDLRSGESLGDADKTLRTYPVRVEGGAVWIGLVA